ncbi:aminoglycoside phosphotransferase family protein [Streptomyces sp. NPDC002640]
MSSAVSGAAVVDAAARDRLVVRFGPEVVAWCDALPGLVGELAGRWRLRVLDARGGGTSRVFRCRRRDDDRTVWLKVTPDAAVAAEEAEALALWADTPAVVDLLGQDLELGALLLEDAGPGRSAVECGLRMPEVAALLRDLRRHAPRPTGSSALRPLADRIGFLCGLAERRLAASARRGFDRALLSAARERAVELCRGGPVGLVHGDLHAGNVLVGADGRVVAIDPRPTWGDPDFDTVDWLLAGVADLSSLERRIGELVSLLPGRSPERLLAWCRALAAFEAVPGFCAGRDDARTRFLRALAED